MDKIRVLFLCVHNSARSQMAEAFLKHLAGHTFDVMSAGLEPGTLNPVAVEAMKEKGIDISRNKTKSAFDLYEQNMSFTYVVTVCDQKAAEQCPLYPGETTRLHWPFDDPSSFNGTEEEVLEKTRIVRDQIEKKIEEFITTHAKGGPFDDKDRFIIRS